MSDDAELIKQILNGDQKAYEQLMQRYDGTALALAWQYVDNIHDAQDIVQDAFCSAYIYLPKLEDHSRFKAWFLQIVMNHARMWIREHTRRTKREEIASFNPPVEYERFVESLAWREIIEKAIKALSPSDQAIVTLYYFDDCICQEVADALGLPVGTVKRRLHGIRKVLKKEVRTMLNEKGVLKYRVGIETLGGVVVTIFPKGTSLPVKCKQVFTTATDKQKEVDLHLVEGDEYFASKCRDLGRFTIKGFSAAPKGTPQLAITITIEKDGTISFDAVEKIENRRISVESQNDSEPIVSIETP